MVALGVDFGTSHTVAVARWPDGRARPLLFDGSPLLPSAVHLDQTGLIVGRDALHAARRAPEAFEPNPKRRIDEGSVLLGEQDVPVRRMMTAVFGRVLAEFTRATGRAPRAVTVTHPAGWAATRRRALTDAVRAAGLPDAVLVPEPVAAATYFVRVLRHMVPVGNAVVVYDLGAGTFDGSVVARTAAGFEVLAVGGRDDLGGLDFDEVVVGLLARALPPDDWQRVTADPRAGRQVRDEAREAKERLSRAASATVMVPLLDVDVPLTRDEFEGAARPLVERSVRVLAETLRLSRLTPDRIAGIFLVGGASQMPLVATELHREFGRPPVTIEQPELVVAEGSVLVGPAVPAQGRRAGAPSRASSSGTPALPSAAPPSSPAAPPPSVSGPPVSPGAPQVSPGAPVSPPAPRRPLVAPVPYPPRPYYPPPPQVVYYPAYPVLPAFVPRPQPKGPWSVRWPAGFMTAYAVLLYLLTGVLLLVATLPHLSSNQPPTYDGRDLRTLTADALEWAAISAVLATLLIHAANRARRAMSGHHWYPLALCLIVGTSNLAFSGRGGGPWTQVPALVFLGSAAMLLLPGSRRWTRRPPNAPPPAEPGPPEAPGG